ncbi:MAG: hypothetical protein KAW52_00195 [candidate division Zixibacteria bacterium]|nr:hypothetical protein [candidate division Zixibacteria bacterium]
MANIIVKGKTKIGKTRSEQEVNMRKEWGPTMNDKNLDKLKFLEKKAKKETGSSENFFPQTEVEKVE